MMHIVPMTAAHLTPMARIEKECFSDPWSRASLASELENPLALWLVALEGETVVGYVGSQAVLGEADMMNLAVAPLYRRRGVGESLTRALIAALAEKKVHSLTLEVRVSNGPARGLYEKLGFSQVGCRKNYYEKPREDALLLRKEWLL